jgi:hypothetical protein
VIHDPDRQGASGQPGGDYDVSVFLRDLADRPWEINRLADLATAILYDVGETLRPGAVRNTARQSWMDQGVSVRLHQ